MSNGRQVKTDELFFAAGRFLCGKRLLGVWFFIFFFDVDFDVELAELFAVDDGWRICHEICGVLGLREGDDVADGVAMSHEHEHAVDTDGQSPVWWCAVFKSVEEHAEAFAVDFFGKAEKVEHFFL